MDPVQLQTSLTSCIKKSFPVVSHKSLCCVKDQSNLAERKSSQADKLLESSKKGTCEFCGMKGEVWEFCSDTVFQGILFSSLHTTSKMSLFCGLCSVTVSKGQELQQRSVQI